MKVVDLNLLLYAVNRQAPLHERAKRWWEGQLALPETLVLPWVVILGFLRVATSERVFPSPLPPECARGVVAGWLGMPSVRVLEAGPRHWEILDALLLESGTAGNLTTDAHLAALAIENGAELVSSDADFGRFRGLRWSNPLVD